MPCSRDVRQSSPSRGRGTPLHAAHAGLARAPPSRLGGRTSCRLVVSSCRLVDASQAFVDVHPGQAACAIDYCDRTLNCRPSSRLNPGRSLDDLPARHDVRLLRRSATRKRSASSTSATETDTFFPAARHGLRRLQGQRQAAGPRRGDGRGVPQDRLPASPWSTTNGRARPSIPSEPKTWPVDAEAFQARAKELQDTVRLEKLAATEADGPLPSSPMKGEVPRRCRWNDRATASTFTSPFMGRPGGGRLFGSLPYALAPRRQRLRP